MKANDTYYVIGSHMAGAKSTDLIDWTQLSTSVQDQHFFADLQAELGKELEWGHTRTFWAGCFIQLQSGPLKGKYMMHYCVCQGGCPQAALGYAIADNPEGPYKNMGVQIYSFGSRGTEDTFDKATWDKLRAGESGDVNAYADVKAPDGTTVRYNSNFMPNAIDPCTFYDATGQLWLLYGSYSGGIFMLKLNPDGTINREVGDDYYGKYIMGGYHTPIEGPFIMYSPETEYYYLFNSYGGLNARGGYNIRVARSKNPTGPFLDPAGQSMLDCKGVPGQTMGRQNAAIEKYGLKLMGNFEFLPYGNEKYASEAYMSPGHNSAYYDADSKRYFLFFHSRFKNRGERFEVRVHEMFMNADGWPVVAPHRYDGELSHTDYSVQSITGSYKFVNHGTATTGDIVPSILINLNSDGTVSGAVNGTWKIEAGDNHYATLTLDGQTYKGVFYYQYDPANSVNKMTFTACSNGNNTVWGSKAE
jgi:arabinan endo-1,5-alpha-L-arabinosidase